MIGWFAPQVFMGPAQRRMACRGVPVFTYHKIARPPAGTRDPFLYVDPAYFDAQLTALRRFGFTSGTLADLRAIPAASQPKAIITFDDGFRNVLDNGLEILARNQFRAIQFLVSGFLGRTNEWDIEKGDVAEPLMDEGQVRTWLVAGHEIGSHSATHRNLKRLDRAEAHEEIFASKKSLEDRFGTEVRHFCYPFGGWNESVRDMVGEAGYHTACTVAFGVNDGATPRLELRRIIPLSGTELLSKVCHRLARRIRGANVL